MWNQNTVALYSPAIFLTENGAVTVKNKQNLKVRSFANMPRKVYIFHKKQGQDLYFDNMMFDYDVRLVQWSVQEFSEACFDDGNFHHL